MVRGQVRFPYINPVQALCVLPEMLLAGFAGLIAAAAYIPYLWKTWKGVTRPNRTTWWIYTVVGGVATASSYAAGARWTLVVPLVYVIGSLVVALLAIRRGEGGSSWLDRSCLATAAISILVWQVSGDPLLAVIMNSLADIAGSVPTMVKAWRDPARENRWAWFMFFAANGCTLFLVPQWTLAFALYPSVLFFCATIIAAGCWSPSFRRR